MLLDVDKTAKVPEVSRSGFMAVSSTWLTSVCLSDPYSSSLSTFDMEQPNANAKITKIVSLNWMATSGP